MDRERNNNKKDRTGCGAREKKGEKEEGKVVTGKSKFREEESKVSHELQRILRCKWAIRPIFYACSSNDKNQNCSASV